MGEKGEIRGMIAAIRVRGKGVKNKKIRDTLEMLNLKRVNNCVVIPEIPQYLGMLKKCSNAITYGEIDQETLEKLLKERGRVKGKKLTDQYIRENSKFKSIEEFAKAIIQNKATLKEVGLKVFRLRPPKKGWGGIKSHYPEGALGYRGKEINKLLNRMI